MNWDPSPFIFSLSWFEWAQGGFFENFGLRWYSLLFVGGFLVAYLNFLWMARREGKPTDRFENMLIVIFVSAVVGARLGHCLFYDPEFYLMNPLEMLKVWEGGLASHGGTLGVIIGVYIWQKTQPNLDFWWLADRICVATPIAAGFIRLGNFMNQEILGEPTTLPWGVKFLSGDPLLARGLEAVARHPSQLYEALSYFLTFAVMHSFYRWKFPIPPASGFGLMLVLIYSARFFIEYSKTPQASFQEWQWMSVGQILSLPFVAAGVLLMLWATRRPQA